MLLRYLIQNRIPKTFFFYLVFFILALTPLNRLLISPSLADVPTKETNVIVDEFLVNDDDRTGLQWHPAIAIDRSGNFVVAWLTQPNGGWDVYTQRYDSSGIPLDSNFKVNDARIAYMWDYKLLHLVIAGDRSGSFVIAWVDRRNGHWDIYAQRYDSSSSPLDSNFKVNKDAGIVNQLFPAIDMNKFGDFIISWTDYRNGSDNPDIYAQRYNSSGIPLGSNFKVNESIISTEENHSSIAVDDSGNFVIVWDDYRNGNPDIYAQRYASSGTPLDSNFKISECSGNDEPAYPAIAGDNSGNFVIAWVDKRNGNWDIYAKRYNPSGDSLGPDFMVNNDVGTAVQNLPDIEMDSMGNFIISWADYRNGHPYCDFYAQRYNSSGICLGSNFRINDSISLNSYPILTKEPPFIAMNESGNFTITWCDTRNGNWDIYAQRYNLDGTPLGSNFKVNIDIGYTDQNYPSIAQNSTGDFVISWQDGRYETLDIFAQKYNSSILPLDSNFPVNSVTKNCWHPDVAMDASGQFIITWQDERNDWDPDIYTQRYDSEGNRLGPNSKVNDDTGSMIQWFPDIDISNSSSYIIAWQDFSNGAANGPDIFARIYSSTGTPLGPSFRVNDDFGPTWQGYPSITMVSSDNFITTWIDKRNADPDIYVQRNFPYENPLLVNFRVNDDNSTAKQWSPCVVADRYGNFIITWEDYRNGDPDIYAQRYDSSGTPLGSNFKVNDDIGITEQKSPVITMDFSGRFVIAWEDYRNSNPDIYSQKYDSLGNPKGTNFSIVNPLYSAYEQSYPAISANASNICFVWQDNRRGNWDIYAKVVDWNWTAVDEEQNVSLPESFILSQNYPNPFNPTTTIHLRIVGSGLVINSPIHTSLVIYNILGQKIRTLIDEKRLPGNYKVIWDGKDDKNIEVSSGVYFYQLKINSHSENKKMVLLK